MADSQPVNRSDTERGSARRYRFTPEMRVRSKRDFEAVYKAAVRTKAGPLLVYARPNGLTRSRLGLAIARRVGNAVRRHRLKRLLRESFRLLQYDLPSGYDFLISAQSHGELAQPEYQRLLLQATSDLERKWQKKQDKHDKQNG